MADRLISADALAEEIAKVKRCIRSENSDYLTGYISALSGVEGQIAYMPTVDAVEVVRCENCKWHEPCKPYNKVWCQKMGRYMKPDGFCSEGAMKE